MPVWLDHPGREARELRRKPPVEFRAADANCIEIGLVNNMPSAALETSERQFRALLEAAAGGIVVRLTLHTLPEVSRTEADRRQGRSVYSDINDLWDGRLDGLIVTGTEPRTPDLMDEPYWPTLAKLLEWAERNTHSSIWSCLAAHAGLLHFDGIVRRRLSDKRFGIFECARVSDHFLTTGVPARFQVPHSRQNDVPEHALTACGYRILTKAKQAGVDAFVKQRTSLFLFFQGHPEYDPNTLLLEYRRDIGRFLRGERDTYPSMPYGCFNEDTRDALAALRKRALTDRRAELVRELPVESLASVGCVWSSAAVSIYRNWLEYLCSQKAQWLKTEAGRQLGAVRSRPTQPEPVGASGVI